VKIRNLADLVLSGIGSAPLRPHIAIHASGTLRICLNDVMRDAKKFAADRMIDSETGNIGRNRALWIRARAALPALLPRSFIRYLSRHRLSPLLRASILRLVG
jgi:hypothetical protein